LFVQNQNHINGIENFCNQAKRYVVAYLIPYKQWIPISEGLNPVSDKLGPIS